MRNGLHNSGDYLLKKALAKEAGWKTELAGQVLNPGNWLGGTPAGALAALATDTRSIQDQAEHDESRLAPWANIFMPGAASYNQFKRLGAAIRSPEMLSARRGARRKKRKDADEKDEKELKAASYPQLQKLAEASF